MKIRYIRRIFDFLKLFLTFFKTYLSIFGLILIIFIIFRLLRKIFIYEIGIQKSLQNSKKVEVQAVPQTLPQMEYDENEGPLRGTNDPVMAR